MKLIIYMSQYEQRLRKYEDDSRYGYFYGPLMGYNRLVGSGRTMGSTAISSIFNKTII
jgi:hypothetical protein